MSGVEAAAHPLGTPAELTLEALFDAYFDCRRHKRNSHSQLAFEINLERNLMDLWYALTDGSYRIGPTVAFVITAPRVREVWAAQFRDRIVHHLIYNAIAPRFLARFIRDSYACIPGRGTHDGLRRVQGFARSVTQSWARPAWVLKTDVANFFTSIDRRIVLDQVLARVPERWLRALISQVLTHDPRPEAQLRSSPALFAQVPRHKSLLHAPDGFGLPIGNLTSQFFANIHLDALDQHVKHDLRMRWYGRYVDDMVLMDPDPARLNRACTAMDGFLGERLGLALHPQKTMLQRIERGFDWVGFVVKPGRTYLRRRTLANARRRIAAWRAVGAPLDRAALEPLAASLTSTLAMLRQVDGYRARDGLCARVESLFLRADTERTKLWTT